MAITVNVVCWLAIVMLSSGCGSESTSATRRIDSSYSTADAIAAALGRIQSNIMRWESQGNDAASTGSAIAQYKIERFKQIESRLRGENSDQYVTSVPQIVTCYLLTNESGDTFLTVRWLEESTDFRGIRVREVWTGGTYVDECFIPSEEDLSLVHNRFKREILIQFAYPVHRRSDGAANGQGAPRSLSLSFPSEERHVFISLVDEDGHESQAISLRHFDLHSDDG
jgi:hypothetical protein